MLCTVCQLPIEPEPRYFTGTGAPRHMLCSRPVFTSAGLAWARRHEHESVVARVALYGVPLGWPQSHEDAAIRTCNHEAERAS